jgi:type I restriction enzyme, S subunit
MIPNGWSQKSLNELASVERGKFSARPRNNPKYYGGEIPFVQTGDIREANGWLRNHSQTLNQSGLTVSRLFPAGTILVTIAANIGDVALTSYEVACPDSLVAIQAKKGVSNTWLMYVLQTKKHKLESIATQNAQKNINLQILRPLQIITPPYSEQCRIAEILVTWDKSIAKTKQLITALQTRKKGLIQRLLTGEVHFPGFDSKWDEMELGQFLKPVVRKVEKPKDGYLRLGLRSHGKGTFKSTMDDVDSEAVAMTHLFKVKEGDLIVNITFAWEGAIAIVGKDGDGALVSHRFPTYEFDTKKILPEYFRYVMLTKRFFYDLGLISPGGAGRNRVMSKKDFLKLRVKVPSIEEQGKIGQTLVTADEYINSLSKKLELLQQQKRGLMQRLLTGQVRVKV